MAAEYGISATGVGTVIQKRLSALRKEGPTDSSEWDTWSERKAKELGISDVQRFTEALWGKNEHTDAYAAHRQGSGEGDSGL